MKEPAKTYGETALFLERPADDGWPDDAGLWPLGGCISPEGQCSAERVEGIKWFYPPRFIKSLLGARSVVQKCGLPAENKQ